MIFTETKLKGAFIIDLDRKTDERGFFARAFCQNEFRDHGLKPVIAQANVASNAKKGTLRGMHFQYPPAAESKLVRCTRAPSSTLSSICGQADYLEAHLRRTQRGQYDGAHVPERFAHGFGPAARQHGHELPMGEFYPPTAESRLRHDDRSWGSDATAGLGNLTEGSGVRPLCEIENEVKRRMSLAMAAA
jgi:dTDP-4-dehydrorhamnose 3,5-epimerase